MLDASGGRTRHPSPSQRPRPTHRPRQPLFVDTLIARGSLEENIQPPHQSKAHLASGLLDSGGLGQLQLGEDELRVLFAPLGGE